MKLQKPEELSQQSKFQTNSSTSAFAHQSLFYARTTVKNEFILKNYFSNLLV